jgi:hypothetical protein
VSIAELHREIGRRERQVGALAARRAKVAAELGSIDRELAQLGAYAGGAGPGRATTVRVAAAGRRGRPGGRKGNTATLVESLHKVLQGATMGVTEVAEAVQKAGYKTSSPNFRTIVNQALLSNTERFKKVARGKYTAK